MTECQWCKAELKHNPDKYAGGGVWESEDLLLWCDKSPDHKHHPDLVKKYRGQE